MKTRIVALGLALVLATAPGAAIATRSEAPPRPASVADQILPQDPSEVVRGEDACAVLTDEELLRAVEGDAILSRTPGAQGFLPAGCVWEIEAESASSLYSVYLGIATEGGRRHYDSMVPFDDIGDPVSGIGDEAVDLGFGSFLAVEGDTVVSIETTVFGGGRPDSLVSRALGWVALTRLATTPALLAVAALAGPGVLPTDQPSLDAVMAIRDGDFGDAAVAATVDLLAAVGIEVVDPATHAPLVTVSGTPSPLRVMDFQARSLAVEAWAGGGLTGAALDGALEVPDDAPLVSSILAGWLAAVDSPHARLARALMAGQDVTDPTSLSFPALALLLFSADLIADTADIAAAAAEPEATALAAGGRAFLAAELPATLSGPRTAQGDICTTAQSFVDDAISTVFGVLKLPVPGNVAGAVVVSIWNWLVSRGEDFVRTAVNELTAPVIGFIRTVAGVIAIVGQVVSATQPYAVAVSAEPHELFLPVDPGPPVEGYFEAIVTSALPDWPETLKGCARVAGVTLPGLTPRGKPVTWSALRYQGDLARSPLLTEGAADTFLGEGEVAVARKRWTSLTEPADWADGPEHTATVTVGVRIVRDDVRDGLKAVARTLYGGIPSIIRAQVRGELEPRVDAIIDRATSLLDVTAPGSMLITYHTALEPTPSPDGTPRSSAVWVHMERAAVGDAIQAGRVLELVSCSGPYGPWTGVMRVGGLGPVPFSELPVAFSFPGSSGAQTTRTSTSGTIPWILPGITSEVHYDIEIEVDGRTMVITISGTANEQVQGQELIGDISASSGPQSLSIEPAPAGLCAPQPTPTPAPTPRPTSPPPAAAPTPAASSPPA